MQILRLIPHEVFNNDFPHQFQHDFVHFFDIENKIIEFRSVKDPWSHASRAIRLSFNPEGRSSMQIGIKSLVEMATPLGSSIATIFSAIEKVSQVVVTASEGKVEVELPRFGLHFFINGDGLLESEQLHSTVSETQEIGCLYGLRNKIVLSGTQNSVLIPLGTITVSHLGGYKRVEIQNGEDKKVRFVHWYQNTTLGTLQGTSDMTEILYKSYLLALTSFPRPNPLSQQTGTAEALSTLAEKRLKSSFPLSKESIGLLAQIMELTPRREFYPRHLRRSQRVIWHPDLDQLSQHDGFFVLALEIFSHNARFAMLSSAEPLQAGISSDSRGSSHLLKRSYLRNLSVQIPCPDRREQTEDEKYESRDQDTASPRSLRVYNTAALIMEWPSQVEVVKDLPEIAKSWEHVTGYRKSLTDELEMSLSNIISILPDLKHWGYLYELCHNSNRATDTYKLLFLFSMMAFEQESFFPYLRTLLGIAFSSRFKKLMPDHSTFDLTAGANLVSETLETRVAMSCPAFEDRENEALQSRQNRHDAYLRHKQHEVELVARFVEAQWPCATPHLFDPSKISLLDISAAGRICQDLFAEWYRNLGFVTHIEQVGQILQEIDTNQPMVLSRPRDIPKQVVPVMNRSQRVYPSLVSLMGSTMPPKLEEAPKVLVATPSQSNMEVSTDLSEQRRILESLRSGGSETRKTYADDLLSSVDALEKSTTTDLPDEITESMDTLIDHNQALLSFLERCVAQFVHSLRPVTPAAEVASLAGLWPRVTPYSLLECLAAPRSENLSSEWKQALIFLGEAISLFQRADRLVTMKTTNNIFGFYKEAGEMGRQGWKSLEHPEGFFLRSNATSRFERFKPLSPRRC